MIHRRSTRMLTIAVLAMVGLFYVEASGAQTFGRVKFIAKKADGELVQGVKITVTCRELGKFEKELKTNKRGEAILSVVDATKTYQYAVEWEGHTIEEEVRPRLRDTMTREIFVGSTAPAPTTASTEGTLTPAQSAFNDGVKAAQADDYTTAKAKFLESIELDPELAPPHLALAGILYDEKDYEGAVRHASRLVELDKENTRGYRILYEAHSDLGNKKEARQALDVLSVIGGGEGGDTAAVLYNEGVAALRVGDDETAIGNFKRALEIQPDLTPALSALAQVSFRAGQFAEAAETAELYLTHKSDDEKIVRLRWEAYRALGDAAKEKEAFDALAALDPQVLVTEFFNAGAKLFDAGDSKAAQENFEKVLAIDPEHPRAHYQLGLCLIGAGDSAGAKEHFEKFLELAPEDPEAPTAKEMLSYLE